MKSLKYIYLYKSQILLIFKNKDKIFKYHYYLYGAKLLDELQYWDSIFTCQYILYVFYG
tara:strand:- start:469 stop:645 length:177 start_codon:yes stop_codon:yes gene_type:complete